MPQVTVDMSRFQQRMLRTKKDIKKFMTNSLNETAEKVKAEEIKHMNTDIDRPTRFTLNSIRVFKATGTRMRSVVQVLDVQAAYLKPIIKGATLDTVKPLVFPKYRNRYGNAPKNMTKNARISSRKNLIVRKLSNGKTELLGTWSHRRTYHKQYDFFSIGYDAVRKHWRPITQRNIRRYLVTGRL